jgi:hypothetical protein
MACKFLCCSSSFPLFLSHLSLCKPNTLHADPPLAHQEDPPHPPPRHRLPPQPRPHPPHTHLPKHPPNQHLVQRHNPHLIPLPLHRLPLHATTSAILLFTISPLTPRPDSSPPPPSPAMGRLPSTNSPPPLPPRMSPTTTRWRTGSRMRCGPGLGAWWT